MAPMIGVILSSFVSIASRSKIRDDDPIDQLNHWATSGLLVAMAMGSAAKQYVGDPIRCWVPAHFKKKYFQKYSDSYCWIHPMYNIPMEDHIPFEQEDRWYNDISFYRWVFIVFLIQAFFFKLPNLVWNGLKDYSGLNVSKIVDMALETSMMTEDERNEKLNHVAIFIDRWLKTYSQYRFNAITRFRDTCSTIMFCFGKRTGKYLSGLYMFTKILYFFNIFLQFTILSMFLDIDFWGYGIHAVTMWRKTGNWQDVYNFPRIGLCDYKIRQQQNVQTHTVQCVLSINLFLEKMYMFLWFWLMFMLIANSINLFQWLMRGLLPKQNESFMKKYMLLLGIDTKQEAKLFSKFTYKYLKTDGMFMLRIVATNTSEIMTSDLIMQLWNNFKSVHGLAEDVNHADDDGRRADDEHKPSPPSAPAELDDDDDDIPLKKMD